MDANFCPIPKSPLAVHLGLSSVELRKTLAIASESNQHSFMLCSLTQAIGIVEEIKAELQMKGEKDKFEAEIKEQLNKVKPLGCYSEPNPMYATSSQSIAEAFNRTWG